MKEEENLSEHARFITSDSGHSLEDELETKQALTYDEAIKLVQGMPLEKTQFEPDINAPRLSTNLVEKHPPTSYF